MLQTHGASTVPEGIRDQAAKGLDELSSISSSTCSTEERSILSGDTGRPIGRVTAMSAPQYDPVTPGMVVRWNGFTTLYEGDITMYQGQIATVIEDSSETFHSSQKLAEIPPGEYLIQINLVTSISQTFTVYRKQLEIIQPQYEPVSAGMVVRWVSAYATYEGSDGGASVSIHHGQIVNVVEDLSQGVQEITPEKHVIKIKHDLSSTEITVWRYQLEIVREFDAVSPGLVVRWVDPATTFLQIPDPVVDGQILKIENGQIVSVVEDLWKGCRQTALEDQMVKISAFSTVVDVYRRQLGIVEEFDSRYDNYVTTRNLPEQFAEFNNEKGKVLGMVVKELHAMIDNPKLIPKLVPPDLRERLNGFKQYGDDWAHVDFGDPQQGSSKVRAVPWLPKFVAVRSFIKNDSDAPPRTLPSVLGPLPSAEERRERRYSEPLFSKFLRPGDVVRYRGADRRMNPVVAEQALLEEPDILVANKMSGAVVSVGELADSPWNTPITIRFDSIPGSVFSILRGDLQFVRRALADGDTVKYVGRAEQLVGYFEEGLRLGGEKVDDLKFIREMVDRGVVRDDVSDPTSQSVMVQFEKRQDLNFDLPRVDLKLIQRRVLVAETRVQYRGNELLKKYFQLKGNTDMIRVYVLVPVGSRGAVEESYSAGKGLYTVIFDNLGENEESAFFVNVPGKDLVLETQAQHEQNSSQKGQELEPEVGREQNERPEPRTR